MKKDKNTVTVTVIGPDKIEFVEAPITEPKVPLKDKNGFKVVITARSHSKNNYMGLNEPPRSGH